MKPKKWGWGVKRSETEVDFHSGTLYAYMGILQWNPCVQLIYENKKWRQENSIKPIELKKNKCMMWMYMIVITKYLSIHFKSTRTDKEHQQCNTKDQHIKMNCFLHT
jgi:hypothetical protein